MFTLKNADNRDKQKKEINVFLNSRGRGKLYSLLDFSVCGHIKYIYGTHSQCYHFSLHTHIPMKGIFFIFSQYSLYEYPIIC